MDRKEKKQPAASKQHLIEMGVCKNFRREKNCLFTEEEKKGFAIGSTLFSISAKNMLSLPVL
jgi:hypothetical protein